MPAFIASALRYLVIAAMQIGVFSVAQTVLDKGFTAIQKALTDNEGMSAEEAENSIAAEVLATGGALGANAALIRSRLPLRWADKLKLVTTKPTISSGGNISDRAGTTPSKIPLYKGGLLKTLGVVAASSLVAKLFWIDTTIQNFLDQGTFNPSGANRALQAIGLGSVFQWPETPKTLQPGTYDAKEFLELFNQLTTAGAVGINATYENQTQIWSKENLSALVNYIVGTRILESKPSDKRAIKSELSKYILTRTGSDINSVTPTIGATSPQTTNTKKPFSEIKIFTGVVSNGTLGTPNEFIARPDDMIQDADELKLAAKNNLSSFVQSIPGKFFYEIAIVNSIKTRGGFTQKGEPIRVISSYNKDGTPRYKTIYHKFAVLKIGLHDENGRNIKLGTIVLGPVNSIDFQPTTAQLGDLAKTINPELFTTNVGDITKIITQKEVTVTSEPPTNPNPPTFSPTTPTPTNATTTDPATGKPQPQITINIVTLADGRKREDTITTYPIGSERYPQGNTLTDQRILPDTPPVSSQQTTTTNATQAAQKAATTLWEFYNASGTTLPTLQTRALAYQTLGLGQSSTYTGTTEQNNRLLAVLKQQANV